MGFIEITSDILVVRCVTVLIARPLYVLGGYVQIGTISIIMVDFGMLYGKIFRANNGMPRGKYPALEKRFS